MSCPEGEGFQTRNEILANKNELSAKNKSGEESAMGELSSFKNPKTWKKSISNFFRNQIRSTRSNDGDQSGSNEHFEDREISREQKWQSLGKVFRRQSFAEHLSKTPKQQAECLSTNKRLGIKSVFSYFGKSLKSPADDEN